MKRKMTNSRGFTLAEVLASMAILAIFVSTAIVGTTALFGTGEQMMDVSKAAVLGSDVLKIVTNEVRFGEEFSMNEASGTVRYNSTSYGDNCEITVDGTGMLVIVQTTKGKDAEGADTEIKKTFQPLGTVAYDEVHIKSIEFSVASSAGSAQQTVTCTVVITSDGTNSLWQNTVTAVPLYQKTLS